MDASSAQAENTLAGLFAGAISRREFVRGCAVGLSCVLAGSSVVLTPKEAQAAKLQMAVFSTEQAKTLGTLADAIVPGALESGVIHFIDKQLQQDNTLLLIKYLGIKASDFEGFYKTGLNSALSLCLRLYKKGPISLSEEEAENWVGQMAAGNIRDWSGPPSNFFFFVIKNDACDVTYGTPNGTERLGLPYMAHIAPTESW